MSGHTSANTTRIVDILREVDCPIYFIDDDAWKLAAFLDSNDVVVKVSIHISKGVKHV